jgi:hypothetical protein
VGEGGVVVSDNAPDLINPNLAKCYMDGLQKFYVVQDGRYRITFLNMGFYGNIN